MRLSTMAMPVMALAAMLAGIPAGGSLMMNAP